MRGEFISVWPETRGDIWRPLIDQGDVPKYIFCELYRLIAGALRDPTEEEAVAMVIGDAIQLREAFENALALAGAGIELTAADEAFKASGATSVVDTSLRKDALKHTLGQLIGNIARAEEVLTQSLSELADDPQRRLEANARAVDSIVNDADKSREAFERVQSHDLAGERSLIAFLEAVFDVIEDIGGDPLANSYFNLLGGFIDKFSLRYDLRRPCILCPTLPGMFSSLVRDMRILTSQDAHLDALMKDYENAVRDLRLDCSDGRIKTCIQKQVNLLEALGASFPGVTETELSGMCNQIGTWPHGAIRASLKNLYGFASDYPGIRHGGNPAGVLRAIEMRDMVAISILLAGFMPYLTDQLSADVVYRGG